MRISLFTMLALVLTTQLLQAAVPKVTRESTFDWRCQKLGTTEFTDHVSPGIAFTTCQEKKESDPTGKYRVQGGTYRIGSDVVTPPPPVAVNCVGTWSTWNRVAGSETACVSSSRKFSETRLFTVTTPASNGGTACPVSPETRQSTEPCTITPPPAAVVTSTGWLVEGWKNFARTAPNAQPMPTTEPDFTVKEQATIEYGPTSTVEVIPGLGLDNYALRYRRKFTFTAGEWTMNVGSDDCVRVFLDDAVIYSLWSHQGLTTVPVKFNVSVAGEKTVKVEHCEGGSTAHLVFTPFVKVVIPPTGSGTVSVRLDLPTLNEDDTPARPPLLVELELKAGTSAIVKPSTFLNGVASVSGVAAGSYTIRARVKDVTGEISGWSNEVLKVVL